MLPNSSSSGTFSSVYGQFESLVRDHLRLIEVETAQERQRVRTLTRVYTASAGAGIGAMISLVIASGFFLRDVMEIPIWLSFTLLAVLLIGTRFLLAAYARGQVDQTKNAMQYFAQLAKEDVQWIVNSIGLIPKRRMKSVAGSKTHAPI